MDAGKRMVNLFLAGSTLVTAIVFSKAFSMIFGMAGVRDAHLLGKQFTTTTLLAVFAALALLCWIVRHERYMPNLRESGEELSKVIWPSWEETKGHTRVTIIVTCIIALILWVFDQVFGNLTSMILGGKG